MDFDPSTYRFMAGWFSCLSMNHTMKYLNRVPK